MSDFINDLDRLTARFEIAVENFFRSAFDLQANEAFSHGSKRR